MIEKVEVSISENTELAPICSIFEQFLIEKLELDIDHLSNIET